MGESLTCGLQNLRQPERRTFAAGVMGPLLLVNKNNERPIIVDWALTPGA